MQPSTVKIYYLTRLSVNHTQQLCLTLLAIRQRIYPMR